MVIQFNLDHHAFFYAQIGNAQYMKIDQKLVGIFSVLGLKIFFLSG